MSGNLGFYGFSTISSGSTLDVSWTPKNISNMVVWYKADTLSLSNGDTVTSLLDMSGNNVNMTNGGAPSFQTEGFNGRPGIKITNGNYLTHGGRYETAPVTVLWAIKWNSVQNQACFLYSTGDNFMWLMYGNTWYVGNGYAQSVTQDANTPKIYALTYEGGIATRYMNGTAYSPQSIAGSLGWYGLGFYSYTQDFTIAEMIIYQKVVSSDEMTSLENYFTSRYAIPIN